MSCVLSTLSNNKAVGHDNIFPKFLKYIATIIAPYLTNSLSKCCLVGISPGVLKIAKITPVYKSGEKQKITNYRPISIWPIDSALYF